MLPVLEALRILLGKKDVVEVLQGNLLNCLMDYDKDNVPAATMAKVRKYCRSSAFDPKVIERSGKAILSVAKWVLALDQYCMKLEQNGGP